MGYPRRSNQAIDKGLSDGIRDDTQAEMIRQSALTVSLPRRVPTSRESVCGAKGEEWLMFRSRETVLAPSECQGRLCKKSSRLET